MERLTKRTVMGIVGNNDMVENYPLYKVANSDPLDHNITEQAFEKLAEYEDAEEKGLLLSLPCKVGDTIYYIEDNLINEFVVYSFDIRPLQKFVCNYVGIRLNFKNFGKTVFLTQAEAEQKLKEMESD